MPIPVDEEDESVVDDPLVGVPAALLFSAGFTCRERFIFGGGLLLLLKRGINATSFSSSSGSGGSERERVKVESSSRVE